MRKLQNAQINTVKSVIIFTFNQYNLEEGRIWCSCGPCSQNVPFYWQKRSKLMSACEASLVIRLQIEAARTWEPVVFHRSVMSWHHCSGRLSVYSENWACVLRLRQTIWVQTTKVETLHSRGGKEYTHCVKRERWYLHLKFIKGIVIMSCTYSLITGLGLPKAEACRYFTLAFPFSAIVTNSTDYW